MSIEEYVKAQGKNLESISKLPHFSVLGELTDKLYELSISLVSRNSPPPYGQLLLLSHRSFLSAITLIGQTQPEDAAAITRRAIEIARIALACKTNHENAKKWMAAEQRMERWKARGRGQKPKHFLPQIKLPIDHPLMKELEKHLGMLSDAWVHFTPEFFGSQDWRRSENWIELRYFTSDQRTIERELIILIGIHASLLRIFDECLGNAFFSNSDWLTLLKNLEEKGRPLAKPFEPAERRRRDQIPEPGGI